MFRGLFDEEKVQVITKAVETEEGVLKHKYPLDDGDGRHVFMSCWNQPGDDVTGIVARTEKIVGTFEKVQIDYLMFLLDCGLSHLSVKISLTDPILRFEIHSVSHTLIIFASKTLRNYMW